MIEIPPITAMTDVELEAWFAAAGLTATVVAHCPDPGCPSCASQIARKAA